MNDADAASGYVYLIIMLGLYFLPLLIAKIRAVPNIGSVAVINGLLGWTVIGWIVALAMAARSVPAVQPNPYVLPRRPDR